MLHISYTIKWIKSQAFADFYSKNQKKINGNLAYFLERKYAVIFAYGK